MPYLIGDSKIYNPALVVRDTVAYSCIEVDSDEVPPPYERGSWELVVANFLVSREVGDEAFTVWTIGLPSSNFGRMGYSVFVAIGGASITKLSALHDELATHLGAQFVRMSDSLTGRELRKKGRPAFHVQDGKVWMALDEFDWVDINGWARKDSSEGPLTFDFPSASTNDYVFSPGDTRDTLLDTDDDDLPDDDEIDARELASLFDQKRAARSRVARKDASVGAIRRAVETVFGMPRGSITIARPDGKAYRKDALISTVRKAWKA